jgi:hypothetical protein
VEVHFKAAVIRVMLNDTHTFEDLAAKVGQNFHLSSSILAFIVRAKQDNPDTSNCTIFPHNAGVLETLYPWRHIKLAFADAKVFVTLTNYEQIEDKIWPQGEACESEDSIEREVPLSELMNLKEQREEEEVRQQISARMTDLKLFTIAETVVYLTILVLWLAYITMTQDVRYLYTMNSTILREFTGSRHVDDVTYSTYESEFLKGSSFFSTRSETAIYAFISKIENNIYLAPYLTDLAQGNLAGSAFIFPYFELRTKRSKVHKCDVAEFTVDWLCPLDLTHELTAKIGQRPPYIDWTEGDSRSTGLRSYHSLYSLSGNFIDMPTRNHTEYKLKQHQLSEVDYITKNTRYIVTTMNFYSAETQNVAIHNYNFEFDLQNDIVASYDLYSFSTVDYTKVELAFAVVLVVLCIAHLVLAFRTLFRDQSEIEYSEQRKVHLDNFPLDKLKALLHTWTSNGALFVLKRLRKPLLQEVIVMVSSVGIIAVVFAKLIWYYAILKPEFTILSDKSTDLIYVAQLQQALYDIQAALVVIEGVGVLKYVELSHSSMTFVKNMLTNSVIKLRGIYLSLLFVGVGFGVCFYLVIGPYEYRTASLYLLVAAICRGFLGRWFAGEDFLSFISPLVVIFLLGAFIMLRYVLYLITVITLQQCYMTTRDQYEAGKARLAEQSKLPRLQDSQKDI